MKQRLLVILSIVLFATLVLGFASLNSFMILASNGGNHVTTNQIVPDGGVQDVRVLFNCVINWKFIKVGCSETHSITSYDPVWRLADDGTCVLLDWHTNVEGVAVTMQVFELHQWWWGINKYQSPFTPIYSNLTLRADPSCKVLTQNMYSYAFGFDAQSLYPQLSMFFRMKSGGNILVYNGPAMDLENLATELYQHAYFRDYPSAWSWIVQNYNQARLGTWVSIK